MKIVKLPPINSLKLNMQQVSNQEKTRVAVIDEPSVASYANNGLIGGGKIGAVVGGKIGAVVRGKTGAVVGSKIGAVVGAIVGGILGLSLNNYFNKEYTILWERQIGDRVRKGEKIATLYEKKVICSKNNIIADSDRADSCMFWEVTSPTNGILQGTLIPSGQSVKGYSNVELALISTIPEPLNTIKIFSSSASTDKLLREELEKHLSVLRREGVITNWHDHDITVGINQQLDSYLSAAHIVLLLISSDFMDSDKCYSIGQMALRRHKRVIPVLLRAIDWKISPIAKLQALPTNAKPITSWENLDEAFFDVTLGIRKVIWEVIETHLRLLQFVISNDTVLINSYNDKILALKEKIEENKSKLQKISTEIDRIQQQLELVQEEGIEEPPPVTQLKLVYTLTIIQDDEGQVKTIIRGDEERIKTIKAQKKHIESTQVTLQQQLDRAKIIIQMCFDEQKQLIMHEKETIELLSKINF